MAVQAQSECSAIQTLAPRRLTRTLSPPSCSPRARRPKTVVTHAQPHCREGKTTLTMNLAHVLGHTIKKVIVVEADMRRPQNQARDGGSQQNRPQQRFGGLPY